MSETLNFLKVMFPDYLSNIQQFLATNANSPIIKSQITQAVASANNTSKDNVEDAAKYEKAGFSELLNGNLNEAQSKFQKAYDAFPVYHNVDEINKLLKENLEQYNQASQTDKNVILKKIFQQIVINYSWGMSEDTIEQFKNKLKT